MVFLEHDTQVQFYVQVNLSTREKADIIVKEPCKFVQTYLVNFPRVGPGLTHPFYLKMMAMTLLPGHFPFSPELAEPL